MQQDIKYTVDIVLCVDATGSMGGIIKRVKDSALAFHDDLSSAMQDQNKVIDSLRVKVIVFRDYYVDGDRAMKESEFFNLPERKDGFNTFVHGINADGGGDEPENGLEALALAFQSAWNKEAERRREIVVVWTDASAHPLEKSAGSKPPNYPQKAPRDFNELTDWWEGQAFLTHYAKRLIVYAPDCTPWTEIGTYWENTIHFPSKAGQGLNDVDYKSIIDAIAHSV